MGICIVTGDVKVFKQCHYTLFEAIDPFKLHPTSILYNNNLFEGLLLQSMGT